MEEGPGKEKEGKREEERKKIRRECLRVLTEVGCSSHVINHCIAVADLALEIARCHNRDRNSVDENLILKGALLHDIGRTRSHRLDHGFVGGEMARSLGVAEKVVRIIQRHVGAGITAEEADKEGLPPICFIPATMEEKIVAHADNLIDGERRISIEEAIADLKKKLGKNPPCIERLITLHAKVCLCQ